MTETFLPPLGSRNTVPAEACESAARWEALRAHYYRQVEVHPEFADYCLALAAYYAQRDADAGWWQNQFGGRDDRGEGVRESGREEPRAHHHAHDTGRGELCDHREPNWAQAELTRRDQQIREQERAHAHHTARVWVDRGVPQDPKPRAELEDP